MSNLIFMLLSIAIANVSQPQCEPSEHSCEFYQCEDSVRQCGDRGYLINFGGFYCQKFLDTQDKNFGLEGQLFLNKARVCLQRKISQVPLEATCKELQNVAFDQHVPCYIDSGFCELSQQEKWQIIYHIRHEMSREAVLRAGFNVLFKCISPFNEELIEQ